MLRIYSSIKLKRVVGTVGVCHAPVLQLDIHGAFSFLACLINLPAISELNSWFFCTIFVLVVGVAAIKKRAHDLFSEASSGPRSMA